MLELVVYVYRKYGGLVDAGVVVGEAGAADWEERLEESGVPIFFGGSAGLCRRYIRWDVAGES